MALQKSIIGVPGVPASSFHYIWETQITYPQVGQSWEPKVRVQIYSWENEDSMHNGGPIVYNWVLPSQASEGFSIPIEEIGNLEQYLATTEGSPFYGSQVVVSSNPMSLESLKRKKHAEINKEMNTRVYATLEMPFGVVDCDEKSQAKITQLVVLAQTLLASGHPVTIDFTLANNSVVELNAEQIIQMYMAGAQREQKLRAIRADLRVDIDAATSAEEVAQITWPF